jgi:hypothetical protein
MGAYHREVDREAERFAEIGVILIEAVWVSLARILPPCYWSHPFA